MQVKNVKRGGCARSIEKALLADSRVAATVLGKPGYPEKGSVEGLKAAAATAKSFVSCAVGRISG